MTQFRGSQVHREVPVEPDSASTRISLVILELMRRNAVFAGISQVHIEFLIPAILWLKNCSQEIQLIPVANGASLFPLRPTQAVLVSANPELGTADAIEAIDDMIAKGYLRYEQRVGDVGGD